jgi:hypothetical protein
MRPDEPNFWQRIRCRWRHWHAWIDANGDGLTDTCAVCGIGCYGARPPPQTMLLDGMQLWQWTLDRYELLKTMILGRSEVL